MQPDTNENDDLLLSYQKFADFLVSVYGQQNEIVLFKIDPHTGDGFVVYSNGEEYSKNDPIGSLGKKVIAGSHKGYNYLINVGDGLEEVECPKKMSYFLIRNSSLEVIGMFLIAFEVDYMFKAKRALDQILGFEKINNRPREYNDLYHELEDDEFSISQYTRNIISSIITEYGISPDRLTVDEKSEILKRLEKMEVFNIKGSIKEAARQLMISIPTIYRMLKK